MVVGTKESLNTANYGRIKYRYDNYDIVAFMECKFQKASSTKELLIKHFYFETLVKFKQNNLSQRSLAVILITSSFRC